MGSNGFKTDDMFKTQKIKVGKELKPGVNSVLIQVYQALKEKGYNPVNQIVGYIMSGDPTYITGHNNARNLISKLERDEILEEIISSYLENNL